MMKRRAAIRSMLYIAGGILVLPACYRQSGRVSIDLTNLSLTDDDELLLEILTETLIPATDTPGGKELLLHLFVLKMVDDCHGPEDHTVFIKGLRAFAEWSKKELNTSFIVARADERISVLDRAKDNNDEDVAKFLGITKRRTIQGYVNSQYVMTNMVKYELVPGYYNGYASAN